MNTLPTHIKSIHALVRDYILYAEDEFETLLEMYDITEQQLEAIKTTPEFMSIAKEVGNEVKSKGKAQLKARTLLESHLATLHNIIESTQYDAIDRIKAIELLAKIADALPKANATTSTGMNVSINFGGSIKPAAIPASDIIEATNG